MSDPTKAVSPFLQWMFEKSHDFEAIRELEGGSAFKQLLEQYEAEGAKACRFNATVRANNTDVIWYGYPLPPEMQLGVFEVSVTDPINLKFGAHTTNYGFALWRLHDGKIVKGGQVVRHRPTDPLKRLDLLDSHPDAVYSDELVGGSEIIAPEYVVPAFSFHSMDGEYRSQLLWWDEFNATYTQHSKQLSIIEDRVIDLVANGELELNFHAHPRKSETPLRIADELRLPIRLFVARLVSTLTFPLPPHALEGYVAVHKRLHILFEDELAHYIKAIGPDLGRVCSAFRCGRVNRSACCGVKLSPMTLIASLSTDDVRHTHALEEFLGRLASDMVINGRTPSFPIFNQTSMVTGVDEEAFENPQIHQQYREGRVADKIRRDLQQMRQGLRKTPRFAGIDEKVFEAARHAEEHLIMSRMALLITMEDVGATWGAMPLRNLSPFAQSSPGFEALVFDLCFAAWNLHEFAVHGDLHTNNITYHPIALPKHVDPGDFAMFVATDAGEKDTFLVPSSRLRGFIIDFSRSLLMPAAMDRVREFGPVAADVVLVEQQGRALLTLARWAPKVAAKYQKELKARLIERPAEFYAVLALVDYVALGANIGSMLDRGTKMTEKEGRNKHFDPQPSCRKFARKLEEAARDALVEQLHRLVAAAPEKFVKGELGAVRAAELKLLKLVFAEFRFARAAPQVKRLVALWNASAPMRYSGDSVKQFPPWADVDNLIKMSGGRKERDVLVRGRRPLLDTLEAPPDPRLALERAKIEADLTQDRPPPDASSSWQQM